MLHRQLSQNRNLGQEYAKPVNHFELIPFTSADALAAAVSSAWLDEIVAANRSGKPHCVALSGGRITLKFFAAVIEQSKARNISLSNVHFFWADERCVPPDDKESSYAAAAEHFFRPLAIAPDKIHRILGELPPERAAQLATEEIQKTVPCNAAGQPLLDIVFLGMGEDGHVASLFPDESEAARLNPAIYVLMQGPSELGASGKLVNWERTSDLPKIVPPTLVIGAKYDTMDPAHMEMMSKKVQKGRYLFCPNGSHLALYDDQKVYTDGLIQFIRDVDAGRF